MMKHQHVEPRESVRIHQDILSRFSVGVHWGTFALSQEYCLEPPLKLKQALEEMGVASTAFVTMQHGETRFASRGRFERVKSRRKSNK